jgi:hypothetical protein
MIFYTIPNERCPIYSTFVVKVLQPVTLCSTPTLRMDSNTGNQLTLRWDAVAGATEYRFEYRNTNNPRGPWITIKTSETFRSLRLPVGKTYAFRVQAICGSMSSQYANIVEHFISPGRFGSEELTDVPEISPTELEIYPNPTDGQFRLFNVNPSDEATEIVVRIFDLSGSEVYSTTFLANAGENELSIDATHLASGIYIVHTAMGDKTFLNKIVKN